MVISSKANYNLLLGRKWIHGVGVVPLTLHQKISIWRPDGIVENVKADQSYFLDKFNHIDKKHSIKGYLAFHPVYLLKLFNETTSHL